VATSVFRRQSVRRPGFGRRLLDDTHIRLAIAIALASVVIELVPIDEDSAIVALLAAAFVGFQLLIASRGGPLTRPLPRLLGAIAFISFLNLFVGDVTTRPMAPLYLPVIAMAAAYGVREAAIVGLASLLSFSIPALILTPATLPLIQRVGALIVTAFVLGIGVRGTVGALETAIGRARTARTRERRQARQMANVEAVGRLLAAGVSGAALDELMEIMQRRFAYQNVSIYLLEDDGALHLGAQRGYDTVIESFDGSTGVVGRVMRTREPALVRDTREDPDYVCAKDDVRSEISVPLIAGGGLIGVLNVEDARVDGLDEGDRSALILVGERLAGAIALGRDRAALTERARLFQALAEFSRSLRTSLDRHDLLDDMVKGVAAILTSDIVVLSVRDSAGEYRITAMHGGDQRYLGVGIPVGEGLSGRAIAEQRLVVEGRLSRDDFPSTVRAADVQDVLTTAAVPLLSEDAVLGALSLSRTDLTRPYNTLEQEILPIVAAHLALAIVNAELHAQLADAAIRDPLTGLFNRRHLDAALIRMFASRERLDVSERHPVAAILFDLDHFGNFNKRHGHGTGDAVLQAFGAILQSRFRASDIVSRFGGEEFLVILDGATLDEATKIADDVRHALEATPVAVNGGRPVHATVSAGCSAVGPEVSSAASLLQVADVGLQMAKRAGRNQVVAA
jgi:diguanylate cyclase (GGDEF)-like protein